MFNDEKSILGFSSPLISRLTRTFELLTYLLNLVVTLCSIISCLLGTTGFLQQLEIKGMFIIQDFFLLERIINQNKLLIFFTRVGADKHHDYIL